MSEADIALAQARAAAARERLAATLDALKTRLLPKAIARNVATTLVDKGQEAARAGADAARARPAAAVGLAAVAALFLARKPIGRAISRDLGETPDDTARSPSDDD